jgi:cytosine/uracil/thiamine/allantoin permease
MSDTGAKLTQGMRQTSGALYELAIPPPDPGLSNQDLAPTRLPQRTWSTYDMASLWVGLSVCIPTYIAGIFIADYWVVRRKRLAHAELYATNGLYGRWNPRALAALVAGITAALVGLAVPQLRWLYDYAWFAGFGVAFAVYVALMRGTAVVDLSQVPPAEQETGSALREVTL